MTRADAITLAVCGLGLGLFAVALLAGWLDLATLH